MDRQILQKVINGIPLDIDNNRPQHVKNQPKLPQDNSSDRDKMTPGAQKLTANRQLKLYLIQ